MSGKKIVIIDYNMGNIQSIMNALNFLGYEAILSHKKSDFDAADGFILPGVGAFGEAMKNIQKHNLIEIMEENVLKKKKPILGICLGMQLLAKNSSEMGFNKGLGWLDATIEDITPKKQSTHTSRWMELHRSTYKEPFI